MESIVIGAALLAPICAGAQDMALIALNSLSAPPASIAGAQVLDQRGHTIGQVRTIATDATGKPAAISAVNASSKTQS